MVVLKLVVLIFSLTQGAIIIERIEITENPDYGTVNISVVNNSGRTAVNLDADMTKTWVAPLTFRLSAYKLQMQTNKAKLFLALPKLPYCEIMRTSQSIPLVIHLMKQFRKFGNLSVTCPIYKSNRYLRNYWIDEADIPLVKTLSSNSRYMLQLIFDDESGKAPVNILRGKVTLKYLKEK